MATRLHESSSYITSSSAPKSSSVKVSRPTRQRAPSSVSLRPKQVAGILTSSSTSTSAVAAAAAADFPSPAAFLPYKASSIAEVQAALQSLHDSEAAIKLRLQSLLASQADLSRGFGRLAELRTTLDAQVQATQAVGSELLGTASGTAGRLSRRVKELEVEKERVSETLEVVEQVAELKACISGVVGSMGAPQDWEAAAAYVARADRVPAEIARGAFAASVVPTIEVPDRPWVALDAARESLCALFLREFTRASDAADGAKVSRFFKLFPLIGRADTGLDAYGRYVCGGVADGARKTIREAGGGSAAHAQALRRLLEHVEWIVGTHSALVERHYGAGRMARVIDRLQAEVDRHAGVIIDAWSDECRLDAKLRDVKSYPFSFLVKSVLASQRGGGGTGNGTGGGGSSSSGVGGLALPAGIPRIRSPALVLGGSSANSSSSSSNNNNHHKESGQDEDSAVDMKVVDATLAEIASMLGCWSVYTQLMSVKCMANNQGPGGDNALEPTKTLVMTDAIAKANLSTKVSQRLAGPYYVLSTFYVRRSVEKAFQQDEMPSGLSLALNRPIDSSPPYIMSAIDVIMYIVDAVVQRVLSTQYRDAVAQVIPIIGRVLGSDFVGMLQRKMRDEYYPKPTAQGGLPPEDKIVAFVVLINSLDVSNDYLARIISRRLAADDPNTVPEFSSHPIRAEVTTGPPSYSSAAAGGSQASHAQPPPPPPKALREAFPFGRDAEFVVTTLKSLEASFRTKTGELLNDAMLALFNNVVRVRIRPLLSDTFRDTNYQLTEAELANQHAESLHYHDNNNDTADMMDANDGDIQNSGMAVGDIDPVSRFDDGWTAIMRPLERLMTPRMYAALLDRTADDLARRLEKRVWAHAGKASALGMVRMERDIGGIIAVVCRGKYALRHCYSRLSQILMVANMEEEEWEEICAHEGWDGVGGDVDNGGGGDGGGGGEAQVGGIDWVLSWEERKKARTLVR